MEKILVVGAGPAGSACAWKLAKAGIHCILSDRCVFPRPKICGGVLSGRAFGLLNESGMISELEIEDLTVQTHSALTISSDYRELRTYREAGSQVRMVNRTEFDAFLRRRALEAGAIPLHDTLMGIAGNTALFRSGEKTVFSRLVGADGASSCVRRSIPGGKFNRPSPALSVVVPLSKGAVSPFTEKGLQIFFFRDLTGYGWLFPRKDDAVAGIGSFQKPHPKLGDMMSRLLVHTGLGTSHSVKGAALPAGKQPIFTGGGSYLLAGDAAGLCDRVSGEGISHAIESGFAAADAIVSGSESWGEGARCIDMVQQSMKYRYLLYGKPFRKFAVRALEKSDGWYARYWNIIYGTCSYKNLFVR